MASKKKSASKKHKKTKAKCQGYTLDQVKKALEDVSKGVTIRFAAKKNGVPFSTLRCKHKGIYPIDKKCGPAKILTDDEEQRLVKWISSFSEKGFPITRVMVQNSVKLLVGQSHRKNPFTGGKPGRHWTEAFLKRNPGLPLKTPQSLSEKQHSKDISEDNIREWFSKAGEFLNSKQLLNIDGSRIFNCNEFVFMLNPKGRNVINHKIKFNQTVTGNSDKDSLTVLLTGNAAGMLAPPMIVYTYKRIPISISEKVPSDWCTGKSENGSITGDCFYDYIVHTFYPWCLEQKITFPIVMYMDANLSYATMVLSDFCAQHQIELVSLYPNCTHLLQPMDIELFSLLKDKWKESVANWRNENGGKVLQKSDFSIVLQKLFNEFDFFNILKNSFAACGLHPFPVSSVNRNEIINNYTLIDINQIINQVIDNSQVINDSQVINSSQVINDRQVINNSEVINNSPVITKNEVMENNISSKINNQITLDERESTLKTIEILAGKKTIELFNEAKRKGDDWQGEEKYRELFKIWFQCQNETSIDFHVNNVSDLPMQNMIQYI